MPTSQPSLLLTPLIFLVFFGTAFGATAEDSIKLQVTSKNDRYSKRGSPQETHLRRLEIFGTVFHLEGSDELEIEWILFGDDLGSNKVVRHASGVERHKALEGKEFGLVTKDTTFQFTQRHNAKSGTGRSVRVQTIDASGIRYHGWSVRAMRGRDVLAEAYSSPQIKKLLETKG